MPRVVVDPGVLIAALLSPRGAPAQILLEWLRGRFDLIVSPTVVAELERVLARPRFRRYVTEGEARAYVAALRRHAVQVDDPPAQVGVTPDPDDDYLVALARAAAAQALVSGDRHLTGLSDVDPPVLTPREFVATLGRLA